MNLDLLLEKSQRRLDQLQSLLASEKESYDGILVLSRGLNMGTNDECTTWMESEDISCLSVFGFRTRICYSFMGGFSFGLIILLLVFFILYLVRRHRLEIDRLYAENDDSARQLRYQIEMQQRKLEDLATLALDFASNSGT